MTIRKPCVLLLFALAACGGLSSDPDMDAGSFDDELPAFEMMLCRVEAQCLGLDEAMCREDVATDMADAKQQLDEAGEGRCAECMHVKTRQLQAMLDAGCDKSLSEEAKAELLAACDLDPNDGVERPDEACAGYP